MLGGFKKGCEGVLGAPVPRNITALGLVVDSSSDVISVAFPTHSGRPVQLWLTTLAVHALTLIEL